MACQTPYKMKRIQKYLPNMGGLYGGKGRSVKSHEGVARSTER